MYVIVIRHCCIHFRGTSAVLLVQENLCTIVTNRAKSRQTLASIVAHTAIMTVTEADDKPEELVIAIDRVYKGEFNTYNYKLLDSNK